MRQQVLKAAARIRILAGIWLLLGLALLPVVPAPVAGADLVLKDGRPFCQAYSCDLLLPQAESFRASPKANLPVIEALRDGKVFAYLFLSTDLVNIPAYSGKPLVTLVAINPAGIILGAKVVHHSEPILLVGIPESVLNEYLAQFFGRHIAETTEIKPPRDRPMEMAGQPSRPVEVHMITGATVTALVLEETLLTSARDVGLALGIITEETHGKVIWKTDFVAKTWDALVEEGSIGHLRVEAREMDTGLQGDTPWIDLYFGDITPPVVGVNLLGERDYTWLTGKLKEGEQAFFIVSKGISSFKGSGFVRGGIFDRFHIEQGLNKFTFKDLDYENLYGLKVEGAPRFRESGIFFLRDTRFDLTQPWKFVLLANRLTGETATSKVFKTFSTTFQFPRKYFDVAPTPGSRKRTMLERIWSDRLPETVLLVLLLGTVMGVFFSRRFWTASSHRLELVHLATLVVSVAVLGLYLKAPPSVTQLFPFVRFFQEGFRFDLFLTDPLLFVFWIFIAVSLLLWGRGWFCGWMCPYGALLELTSFVSKRVFPKKWHFEFPENSHNLLRRLRYVILAVLMVLSVFSLEWAERLAEIEPFKTSWILGVFQREWYFALYWWALLAVSAFNFRFFCRYLCPLGAALSIGSALRLIGIRRKEYCTKCKICARGCETRAIAPNGRINKYECLYCLECEQKYHDDQACPPLIIARREGAKEAVGRDFPGLPPRP